MQRQSDRILRQLNPDTSPKSLPGLTPAPFPKQRKNVEPEGTLYELVPDRPQ